MGYIDRSDVSSLGDWVSTCDFRGIKLRFRHFWRKFQDGRLSKIVSGHSHLINADSNTSNTKRLQVRLEHGRRRKYCGLFCWDGMPESNGD